MADERVRPAVIMTLVAVGVGSTIARGGDGPNPVPCTEEAVIRGLDYDVSGAFFYFGRGVALVDLDRDGDLDALTVGSPTGTVGVFENDGAGFFTDRSSGNGIPAVPKASGIAAGDYDGDRDLDVYISNWTEPNLLLRNEGDFQFVDVAAAAGVADDGPGVGCAWGDFDADGHLDLYAGNRTTDGGSDAVNQLYRNLGDGTFEEVGEKLGVDDGLSPTFQAVFFDHDRDGDPDIYVANDKGYAQNETNRLFENLGGSFQDITEDTQTGAHIDSMGTAVGDYDRNGYQDLYVTNNPFGNVLLLNQGSGPYVSYGDEAGVGSYAIGWAAIFFDYDNDGHLELFACNSDAPNRLYDHDGTWPAVDLAPMLQIDDPNVTYTAACGDIDGDGDSDLLVGDADRVRLYVNHEGQRRNWVKFDVAAPGHNWFGIGANVEITAGGITQLREVIAGSGYKSQDQLTLHFGLDVATVVDEISIMWTGGDTRTVHNLQANDRWTLYHPDLLYDVDQDGDVALDDFLGFVACQTGAGPGGLTPGCEMMDGDGDGDVDVDDLPGLLERYEGPLHDCDGNGVPDLQEIADGSVPDANANGLPDGCEAGGDVNGDGIVDVLDVTAVILNWGPCGEGPCYGDATLDGIVDVLDLLAVLLNWG